MYVISRVEITLTRIYMTKRPFSPQSLLAQGGSHSDNENGVIIPPVYTSTTYLRDDDNKYRSGRVYYRADKPT